MVGVMGIYGNQYMLKTFPYIEIHKAWVIL